MYTPFKLTVVTCDCTKQFKQALAQQLGSALGLLPSLRELCLDVNCPKVTFFVVKYLSNKVLLDVFDGISLDGFEFYHALVYYLRKAIQSKQFGAKMEWISEVPDMRWWYGNCLRLTNIE